MPNYTYVCDYCGEERVENRKIADRDAKVDLPCLHCGKASSTRAHCEATNLDTHFPGSHNIEYNRSGLRKGY
jgi:hypothetical protein